jgi:hypothetical protein
MIPAGRNEKNTENIINDFGFHSFVAGNLLTFVMKMPP